MKRYTVVVFILAILALIDGFLISGISLLGKAGVSLVYTEYRFLKSWWKAGLIVFVVWLILFKIQSIVKNKAARSTSNIINTICLLLAFVGLYFSYSDFRDSLSHRWLGERFHLGVYLFWTVCITISIYYLVKRNTTDQTSIYIAGSDTLG